MGYIKTSAIVLKEVNIGEADKMLTLFAKGYGKISAFAKGARRPKSKIIAGTQYLCFSDFVLFKGREMYNVNSCEVIEPYYEIRKDLVRLTYSAHMIDIVNDVIQENLPSTKVLQLLLNTLFVLANTEKPPALIVRTFELRLLTVLGYAPQVNCCSSCGNDEMASVKFDFRKCGFICGDCSIGDALAITRISPGTAKAMQHIIYSGMKNLFNFTVSDQVLDELEYIMKRYLKDRLEKDYTKLDFLKELNSI